MKKYMAFGLVILLTLGLAACGKTAKEEPSTVGETLLADFQEKMESGEEYTAQELAKQIVENEIIPFDGMAVSVEPGYLNGFREEIGGFLEGACFGPVIGSIPFIGYVFELEDRADVDAFVQNLKDQGDLQWNICTVADELVCDAYGNTVFFVMCPLEFEE